MHVDIKRILHNIKVEDGHILLDKPLELVKYGRKLTIRQVNWFYDWEKFAGIMANFLNIYALVCDTATVPHEKRAIRKFRDRLRLVLSNKIRGKQAFALVCEMFKLMKLPIRWMKRKFGIDDWIEFIIYAYCYNVVGVKKNCKNALALLGKVQSS